MIPKHIYFLGIAGIGVSALAQVVQARGIRVSGADPGADPKSVLAVARLLAGGAVIYTKHAADNLAADVDLIVASAAVGSDNPELLAGRERGIRIVSRAEFLGELTDAHTGPTIAVAGTHGKTTTTAMIGVMLQEAGLDPTVFVGGEVGQLGGNVRVGSPGGPFVAEACEAYDSFLYLKPDIAIITNVEADHLDHYGNYQGVLESFRRFVGNISPAGSLITCADDGHSLEMLNGIQLPTGLERIDYGIENGSENEPGRLAAAVSASAIHYDTRTEFDWQGQQESGLISLSVPGRHNVLNALAAVTLGERLGLDAAQISAGLSAFGGAERRQEILGESGGILVMDDYAHHPTEIRATLDALRGAYPERRLIAIFQPHLYSRTRDFLPEFAETLSAADALLVTDVYSARETQAGNPDVRAADIVNRAVEVRPDLTALYLPDRHDIPKMLAAMTHSGDLTVFLGAGDIREQALDFLTLLNQKPQGVNE